MEEKSVDASTPPQKLTSGNSVASFSVANPLSPSGVESLEHLAGKVVLIVNVACK